MHVVVALHRGAADLAGYVNVSDTVSGAELPNKEGNIPAFSANDPCICGRPWIAHSLLAATAAGTQPINPVPRANK